mgnify:FL=1
MDKRRMIGKINQDIKHRFEFFNYDLDGMFSYLKQYKPYPEKTFEKGARISKEKNTLDYPQELKVERQEIHVTESELQYSDTLQMEPEEKPTRSEQK